jgi:hypothetical protein
MLPVGDVGTQDDIDDFRDRLRTQLETQVSLAQRMAGTVT